MILNEIYFNNQEKIDLSNLQKGFYTIQITDNLNNKAIKTEKLLKM